MKNKFEFGKNWKNFLNTITVNNIKLAKKDLLNFTNLKNFNKKTFIDIGCGSGLSSLAAKKLGAKVYSFDSDPISIKCTKYLKSISYKNDNNWTIKRQSILNNNKIKKLKKFDIVYSWGVLHHTGNLFLALENTAALCKKGGILYLALYNDQGKKSNRWKMIKKIYTKNNIIIKKIIELAFSPFFLLKPFIKTLFEKDKILRRRGMNNYIDYIDWIGGYPFEVSKPEEIFQFFFKKKFQLQKLKTCGGGHVNNLYLFKKIN